MIKKIAIPVLLAAFALGCSKKPVTPVTPVVPPPPPLDTSKGKPNNEHISVFTQHNENGRSGLNNRETVLTTSNVNSAQFGKLFTLAVDDQVYAQPLVYSNLNINSGNHNVVLIATVNNSVYAYDGDKGNLYWKKNFTEAGMRPPLSSDMNSDWCNPYNDISYNIGIVGTPVIDSAAKTIYFVARSTDGGKFVQYLHALDIATGSEKAGSPVLISASVAGSGDGAAAGMINFDPRRNNQRQGLVLVNGVVYISWSSHCDWNPYHGWILGYNAKTLVQQTIYNDTPGGEAGGLWESGMGISADASGNLFVVSGNGTAGQSGYNTSINGTDPTTVNPNPSDLTNRGESAMKLTPTGSTLKVTSFFTPTDYYNLDVNDLDYGVMGTLLIPGTNLYLTGCKDGNLYLLNKDNMGGYSLSFNQVVQTIPLNVTLHCQPAYYKGSASGYMYVWSENDQLREFPFNGTKFATNPTVSPFAGPTGPSGADLSVSSNGTVAGTGIVWAAYSVTSVSDGGIGAGVLRAFDATDITKELWDSGQNSNDQLGNYAKFCSPTVANGKVYMGTFSNKVVVYGLK